MGRKKITIQQITDPKLRNITYNKRKNGLIKKAAEISLLCNINLMLVFEDLNGTLVQFSRNKIKDISNFPKECHYKRVLELTAEDYPDFSRIRRHKKKQGIPEQSSSQAPSVNGNVRTFTDMCSSDQDSIVAKEEIFTDYDNTSYLPSMDMFTTMPDMFYGEGHQQVGQFSSWFHDQGTKKVKTTTIQSTAQISPNSQKENKNKLNLRLKIVNNEENPVKEAMKADSRGSRKKNSSHYKPNSSQKNSYSRRSNFDLNARNSPYQPNVRNSPHDGSKPREHRTLYSFMEALEVDFSQFSPFSSQVIRPSPNVKKEANDIYTNEQIINYFSNSGRGSLQRQEVYSFQPNECQQIQENAYEYYGYGMETEVGSTKKQNYRDQLDSCGKTDSTVPSTAVPTGNLNKFSFSGFVFGSDQRLMDQAKML